MGHLGEHILGPMFRDDLGGSTTEVVVQLTVVDDWAIQAFYWGGAECQGILYLGSQACTSARLVFPLTAPELTLSEPLNPNVFQGSSGEDFWSRNPRISISPDWGWPGISPLELSPPYAGFTHGPWKGLPVHHPHSVGCKRLREVQLSPAHPRLTLSFWDTQLGGSWDPGFSPWSKGLTFREGEHRSFRRGGIPILFHAGFQRCL